MVADLQRWHDRVYQAMRQEAARLAGVSLVLLLVLVSFVASGTIVTRRAILTPLHRLKAGMERVAATKLGFRFNWHRLDEMGDLARTFDGMTDRLQEQMAEKEQSRALIRDLVEGVPDAMFVKDGSGRYLLINKAGASLIGQTPEKMIGSTDYELFHPESAREIIENDRYLMEEQRTHSVEEEATDTHGNSRVYSVTKGPLRDLDGNIVGLFGISRDITERVKAEKEVRRLNEELEERVRQRTGQLEAANKELESFAYSVSHDLRAPLRSMDGFARILFEDYAEKLPEEGRHYLERVRRNAQKMDHLIQHLLSFSRLSKQPLKRKLTDITRIAKDAWNEISTGDDSRRIEITIDPLPSMEVDPNLLSSVFANLLGNAVKYSSQEEQPRIEVGVKKESHPPVIYVSDNGAGFDMAHADKIFDVFQRLHGADEYAGTGVGLATVQRIVHRHGGEIWVEAEEGKGATFLFTVGEAEN